ncbi:unnamed protein product [Rangifer tarandus platyrhynchus]|uniref:Uncharacterized protein n=1 Tax=Rangifer tarandus platyrhynchus TaxID=3082113 RepID=A0ABN8ZQ09_RANTA|nr:unnamed protein product [Rangifer tarandus platyrhynchus]
MFIQFRGPLILGYPCFSSGPLRVLSSFPSSHASRGEGLRGQKAETSAALKFSWDTKSLGIVLGFEIKQAGLPCLRSGSTIGGPWARPFGLGLVEALPYDLLGVKSLPEPRSGRHLAAEARVPQPRCAYK